MSNKTIAGLFFYILIFVVIDRAEDGGWLQKVEIKALAETQH